MSILKKAISEAGSQKLLAAYLDVSPALVSHWLVRKKRIPAEHVLSLERLTGIHRSSIRPDIYPPDEYPPGAAA